MASSADRNWAEALKFNWPQLIRSAFGGGEVRLYVGENDFVKEFKLPPFDRVAGFLDSMLRFRPPTP